MAQFEDANEELIQLHQDADMYNDKHLILMKHMFISL